LGEQSPTFLKVGVNRLAILTIFFALGSSDSCVKREVCSTLSHLGGGVDLPPIVGGGLDAPVDVSKVMLTMGYYSGGIRDARRLLITVGVSVCHALLTP